MYVLIWSYNNTDKKYILRSDRYFLGRPDHQDMKKLGNNFSGFDVLIFNPDNYSETEFTGYRSLIVSRRHALINKRFVNKGYELIIRDHGPQGKGSKNGTFVNDRMLSKGSETVLREGDTIRLSSMGPFFMIGVWKENKTEVSISAGIPLEVPAQIAQNLVAKGIAADHFIVGNRAFVIVNDTGIVELGKDLIVNIERETLYKKALRAISILTGELLRIRDSVREKRDEDARIALEALEKMLDNEFFRKVFEEIGAQSMINNLYNDVIKLYKHEMSMDTIVKNIEVYMRMLKNIELCL